jgi:tetratricopeptide (TPR) repeat protein
MISALIDYLAVYYQTGNLAQMEAVASTILAAIPDDLVALQFLGLAFYQTGRIDDACQAFKRVASSVDRPQELDGASVCEPAGVATFREATRPQSGLADGWFRIAQIMSRLGYYKPATRAFEAALAARGPGDADRCTTRVRGRIEEGLNK